MTTIKDKDEQTTKVKKTAAKKSDKIKTTPVAKAKSSISVEKKPKIVKKTKINTSDMFANWDLWATLLTIEWFEKLKQELEYLIKTRRKEVSERLKEAISFWDLSENSEYEDAKNEQAFVEWRVIELEKKIKNAKIISDTHSSKISIWSTVEVERSWTTNIFIFTIVWTTEAEPFEWRISNESPLWMALMWLEKWDLAKVAAPRWNLSYKILKIL